MAIFSVRFISIGRGQTGFLFYRACGKVGVLSTFPFLVYLDDLLNELESSNKGSHIGFINCFCPTYADDTLVLANSPNAQFLIRIMYKYFYNCI